MTEKTTERPSVPRTKGCAVCAHVEVEAVNAGLALGKSPRRLARAFELLKAHQIKAHRDRCLGGHPLRVLAESMGYILVEEEQQEDGEHPKAMVETTESDGVLQRERGQLLTKTHVGRANRQERKLDKT